MSDDKTSINAVLKKRLLAASTAGAMALAGVLVNWFEGRVYKPYVDPAGILTVCEGITGPDVIPGKTYTDAECDRLRGKHLAIAQAAVKQVIKVPLNPWQQAALIDFTFNLGAERLAGSTMAKLFNQGNYTGGCYQLTQWVKARVKGRLVTLNGLVYRRDAELAVCLGRIE
ncbi:lysozyme [Curvibacter lanceolatus]|uniref:lysozyme n=1 Tax=Curvibacter lanceolatus TaxID=86182 RepID=UPI0003802026|nr:lysozyme [Curvibacter lanceolatus]